METGIHAIHANKEADQLRINQHLTQKPALFFNSKTQIFAYRQRLGSDMDPLIFFDSEVIFHLLFLLGTEESTIILTITLVWNLIETRGRIFGLVHLFWWSTTNKANNRGQHNSSNCYFQSKNCGRLHVSCGRLHVVFRPNK